MTTSAFSLRSDASAFDPDNNLFLLFARAEMSPKRTHPVAGSRTPRALVGKTNMIALATFPRPREACERARFGADDFP
jgi:hypothetical protein